MSASGRTDEGEIVRRLHEYAWGIDTRDWELYRSIFAERIHCDFSSYNGQPATGPIEADAWVAGVRPVMTGLDATQHSMTNPLVDIDASGTTARCRMAMQAAHFLIDQPEPEFTIGGWYDDTLVRHGDVWLITGVTLTVTWRRGAESIMKIARQRGTAALEAEQ